MAYTIKFRRDTADRWAAINPVLKEGEPGFEFDTGRIKIGNGTKPWNTLPYADEMTGVKLRDHIDSEDPHPMYDDGRSFFLLYENAKV